MACCLSKTPSWWPFLSSMALPAPWCSVAVQALKAKGYVILDRGTETEASCDYPDYAHAVGGDVVAGRAKFGILVCTTGIGISIAANKVPGIRAALVQVLLVLLDLRRRDLVLAREMLDDVLATGLHARIQFEGLEVQRDVELVAYTVDRFFKRCQSYRAPRASDIGDEIQGECRVRSHVIPSVVRSCRHRQAIANGR